MFVTDTHPLVWFSQGKFSLLSPKVLKAFEEAVSGQTVIYIPSVVLWETAMLNVREKISLDDSFTDWADKLSSKDGFHISDLENNVISLAVGYSFNNDIFDKAIVATAVSMDLPLITKDVAISQSGLVEIYW